jgi:RES domain-containing protein
MTTSDGWDAAAEVASRPLITWSGLVWRAHRPRYGALDPGGARRFSGRYNCGEVDGPGFQTISAEVAERWPALYLALDSASCLVEVLRHTTKETFEQLNHRLTGIEVKAFRVLDCSDPGVVGLTAEQLYYPRDYRYPHRLALAAIKHGAEALLVPAVTGMCNNLVYFPDHADERSTLTIVRYHDPPFHLDP